MKTKILKKLRKEAKERIYLSQYYSGPGHITIVYKEITAPFGLTRSFYNPEFDIFEQNTSVHYTTVEEALPDLARARRYYILNILHTEHRTFSKGDQKKKEAEILEQQNYQKYLQQF